MDRALISTAAGIFAVDVETGNVGWQLNDSNGATEICSVTDRVFCAPHGNKALIHYWKLNKETKLPDSSGNPIYKCSAPEKFGAIVFSSCGGLMFAGAVSGTMYVWQTWTGNLLKSWTAHFGVITKILLSLDDSVLITASEDTVVKLWDLPSLFANSVAKPKMSLTAHTQGITDMMIHDDSSLLFTSSRDGLVKMFRIEESNIVQLEKHAFESSVTKIAGNGEFFFAGCENGQVFENQILLGTHQAAVTGLGLSLDGSRLVSCSADGVKIWDTNAKILVFSLLGSQQQLKNSLAVFMTINNPVDVKDQLVSAVDSYLQFKPLSRILTNIEEIDKIPLVKTAVSQKIKADKMFCIGADAPDSTQKLTEELAKQKQLAQMWAATAADLVLKVAALNEGEVSLDLPIKRSRQ